MAEPKRNMLDRIADRNEQINGPGILGDLRQIEIDLIIEDVMDRMPDGIMEQCSGPPDDY